MDPMQRTRPEPSPGEAGTPASAPVMAALRQAVRAQHYDTVLRVHCWELAPRWLDASIRQTVARAPEPTRDALRLFFLGERVTRARVDRAFGRDLTEELAAHGILDDAGGELGARYRLEVVGDHLLLAEWPADRVEGVYLGEDSQFLRSVT